MLGVLRRKNIDHIAAHTKNPTMEIDFVALILHFDQALDDFPLPHAVTDSHGQNHFVILVAIADTVNTRNRRDNDAIAAFQQAFGRRKAHLLDMIVDRRVFLDKQITSRNIGFRLIVVVVRNEVLNRVFRKELPKLGIQLCRQRLVRCQNQRRAPGLRDDIGHGVSFPGPGYTQQGLKRKAIANSFNQLGDRIGLVACRQKRLMQPEWAAFKRFDLRGFK